MSWGLILLAETWRLRRRVGLPLLLGLALGLAYTLAVRPQYEARALLQVQTDRARAPLLRDLTAPGQRNALYQLLTNPNLLADTGKDAGRTLHPADVQLQVVNEHMLAVGLRSPRPEALEQTNDALAYNFIQALLAPERLRLEQLAAQHQQELAELSGRLATSDGLDAGSRAQLAARQAQVQQDLVQLQGDLRLVNPAFGAGGSQALIWFAEPSVLLPMPSPLARALGNMALGALLALACLWLPRRLPGRRRAAHDPQQAADASGMPLAGVLPWLGKTRVTPNGLVVAAQGKQLKPSDFGELGRLQRTLVRGRGALVLMGVNGGEGVSTLSYLLAEKTASMGKTVALVDLNLKNRTLSQWFGLGDGNWVLPKAKAKHAWTALHAMPHQPNLLVLAAPRQADTLQKLGEAGGLPALFDHLSDLADVVIVDASPLSATNRSNVDAVAVAACSARTVLVALAGETPAADLKRACDTLLLAGVPLLGVLLNRKLQPTRRQLVGQVADRLHPLARPLANLLRRQAAQAKLD